MLRHRRADPEAQPAQCRAVGDAALAAAEPRRGGGAQPRAASRTTAALFELGPRFIGDHAGRAGGGPGRRALRRGGARGTGPWRRGRSTRSMPRPTRWPLLAVAGHQAGQRSRSSAEAPGMVPSRPLAAACARAGPCWPTFGELHPRVARAFDLAAPRGRLRARSRRRAACPRRGPARRGRHAGAVALPAGRPRLRVRGRRRGPRPRALLDAVAGSTAA